MRAPWTTCCHPSVDLPALDPCVVDDEEALAALLETWAASDPQSAAGEIECFEDALQGLPRRL